MAFTYVQYHNRASSKSAGTTVAVSPIATIDVGHVVWIRVVADNPTSGVGDTTSITVTDTQGNTYERLEEHQLGTGGVGAGVLGAQFFSNLTTALGTGDSVTATMPSTAAKAISIDEFTVAAGFAASAVGGDALDGTGTAPSVTIGSLSSAPTLFLATVAVEGPGVDVYTQGSGFTFTTAAQTSGGVEDTNVVARAGYRIATATSGTYAPTLGTARDYVAMISALREVASATPGAATLAGAGTVSTVVRQIATAALTGAGAVTAAGSAPGSGAATLTGAGAVTASASVIGPVILQGQPYTVVVRDASMARIGKLDRLTALDVIVRFNAVGGWELSIPGGSTQAALLEEGVGVIVHYGDESGPVLMSGPMTELEEQWGTDSPGAGTLVARGVSDDVVIEQALAYQVPTQPSTSQSAAAYDTRTGAAETVMRAYVNANIGPGGLVARRVAGMTLSADGGRGSTVTGSARMAPMKDLLNGLAATSSLGWRVVQVGSALRFEVFAPTDRTASARFAPSLSNLVSYSYKRTAPKVTRAIVGGSGEGALRKFREVADTEAETLWNVRAEVFIDARDTGTNEELDLRGAEALVDGGPQTSLSVQTIDIPNLTFGVHYGLGDRVTVEPSTDRMVQDVLREVRITWNATDGPRTTTEVGTAATTGTPRIISRLKQLEAKVASLESRQ